MSYFPPQMFMSRGGGLQLRWYSADTYALGEKPIWPPSTESETVYRLTSLPAFSGPSVITLTVSPAGDGQVTIKTVDGDHEVIKVERTSTVSRDQLGQFFVLLDQAPFCETPTELPRRQVWSRVDDGRSKRRQLPCFGPLVSRPRTSDCR